MEKKQTAIEWLKKELEDYGSSSHLSLDWTTFDELLDQAIAMEKEQMFELWNGGINCTEEGGKSFDQYYNETYGNKS